MAKKPTQPQQEQPTKPEQEFVIQRLYIKDLSFESPHAPQVFREEWKPEVNMDLATSFEKLEDDTYNVLLTITATVKKGEKSLFLIEVQQAGIFTVKGFAGEQLDHLLGSFCPGVLFPYLRETVTDAAVRGGFPPLYLAPVNFDAFYAERKTKEQGKTEAVAKESAS